jgi:hypothetical protein
MRTLIRPTAVIVGAAGVALLVACVPPHARQPHEAQLKAVSRLNCPDSQGELKRVSASSDGQVCAYAAGDQIAVQLKLVQVSGDPQEAMAPIEADLRKLVTVEAPAPASSTPAESSAPAKTEVPEGDGDGDRDRDVNINLPGIQIHANDGGAANIRVGGIHIDADDRTNTAHIEGHHGGFMGHGGGRFTIDASDNGAVIRSRSVGPDVHQDLILASDKPGPEGWRAVGYEALGPKGGPLVVAIVQSKSDEHDRLFGDVKALVRKASEG